MSHVATRVLPFRLSHSTRVSAAIEKTRRPSTAFRQPDLIAPDLDVAHGIISGMLFGLLVWVGLLLPLLYLLA